MPGRKIPLFTGETYHLFNRGIDRRTTFTSKKEYQRVLQVITFYQFQHPSISLSRFLTLSNERRDSLLSQLKKQNQKLVLIHAFCLMPNHFHFLVRQLANNGISRFMSQLQNSYTRYFNTVHQRVGPLFLDQFKAVRIETDEQLIHVSRYIHLNPYTSFVLKNLEEIFVYPYSSLHEYFDDEIDTICDTKDIKSYFEEKKDYKKFICDQASYQRELDKIKHLLLED